MTDLRWSWLGAPYFVVSAMILAGALAAAFVRGDRVLRLGMLGAATTALPWALCQGFAACTGDPLVATRLLRIGQGPVSLVGPNLLLLLLGVSGQLERQRWIARLAGVIGLVFLVLCWTTAWTVPGVQRLPSGMFYTAVGPLTGVHISLLVVWLAIGLWIVRRSSPTGERRRSTRLVMGVLVFAAIGSLDTLLLYGVWGSYPIAWLPALIAATIALYTALYTDLLRPQGFDREAGLEVAGFALALAVTGLLALSSVGRSPVALAAAASLAWTAATGGAWAIGRARPVRVAGERELDQFVARVSALDHEAKIAELLGGLWQRAIGVVPRATWWRDPARAGALVRVGGGADWPLAPEVVAWLVAHGAPIAITDFATMRLGAMRAQLEQLGSAHGAALVVPLVDREELVGLVEADYGTALREGERGLIAESARAAGRALTFVQLSRAAARERETAREVEIADALRRQASTSRDAELGHWNVAGEYRSAPRTTGAGWSAIELADGRLALLVTEAQAHGVAAAFATAALTGGFSAAAGSARSLDEIMTALRVSADGVTRAGEPVAAFLAILDARAHTIDWACAGHPGALVVGPIAVVEAGLPDGSVNSSRVQVTLVGTGTRAPDASLAAATRGTEPLPDDTLLVVASTALRGDDDEAWQRMVRERAPAAARLASVLVDTALAAGTPAEDLLAVVVRTR
ncbi:MAG TPA: SpoIIE family protein phosphatase [Kofleriaceae bacterium]